MLPIKHNYEDFIIKVIASCSLAIMAVSFILSTSVSYLILHINYKLIYIPITISIFIFLLFFIKSKFVFILIKGFLIGLLIFNLSKLSKTIYQQYFNEKIYDKIYANNKEIRKIVFKQKTKHSYFFL